MPGKEQGIKPIFSQRQSLVTRFALLIILSLAVLFLDHRYSVLSPARQWLTVAATPILFLADLPGRLWGSASQAVMSRNELLRENARLKARNLILEQQVQKQASLTAQNIHLKELLNSSELVGEQVLVAEVVGVDPDPFRHRVTINKGSLDGVYEGQAILDAHGVMGQVVEVSPVSSRVLMLTDMSARIPVQNNRTKYRAIAAGNGHRDHLELLYIPVTGDFREGDLLTSSGLGGTFPEGYPVGTITRVGHNPGDAFATIEVQPLAETNRSRFVLLVFRKVIDLNEPVKPSDQEEGEDNGSAG